MKIEENKKWIKELTIFFQKVVKKLSKDVKKLAKSWPKICQNSETGRRRRRRRRRRI
jgi:hypothetical protein